MTRAEERLYVAGYAGVKGADAGCWHERVARALRPLCVEMDDPLAPGARIWRMGEPAMGDGAVEGRGPVGRRAFIDRGHARFAHHDFWSSDPESLRPTLSPACAP